MEVPDKYFDSLFNSFYAPLVLYSFRLTDDQGSAEDIAQEVFINLWKKLESGLVINSPKSYLYTMVRNASLNWLEKNKREGLRYNKLSVMENIPDPTVLEDMIFTEMMDKIYAVMEKLPKQCKKVFIMHYVEGKKITEIAEELQIGIGTVHTHKFRGIRLLKKALIGLTMFIIYLKTFQ